MHTSDHMKTKEYTYIYINFYKIRILDRLNQIGQDINKSFINLTLPITGGLQV